MIGFDIEKMRRRAFFLRITEAVPGTQGCRICTVGDPDRIVMDQAGMGMMLPTLLSLAWVVQEDEPLLWGQQPVPSCGTPGCLAHLTLTPEQEEIRVVARVSESIRDVWMRGLRAGVFRSVGNYRAGPSG